MKAEDRPRLHIDALRNLPGAKVFARGAADYRDGQVEILSITSARVLSLKVRFGRRRNFMKLLG